MTIFDLPGEMITHIFSMLPTRELLTNVASTCQQFQRLALDPGAHLHVNVNALPLCENLPLVAVQLEKFLREATRYKFQ